jgi:hypothetical protein
MRVAAGRGGPAGSPVRQQAFYVAPLLFGASVLGTRTSSSGLLLIACECFHELSRCQG